VRSPLAKRCETGPISKNLRLQSKTTSNQAESEFMSDSTFTIGWEKELRLIINLYALAFVFLVAIQEWFPEFVHYYLIFLLGVTLFMLFLFQRQITKISRTIDKMVFGGNVALLGMILVLFPLFSRVLGTTTFYNWEMPLILVGMLLLLIGSFLEATRLDEFFLRYCITNPLQTARLVITTISIFFIPVNFPVIIMLLVLLWIDKILLKLYRLMKFSWVLLRELLANIKEMALRISQPGKTIVKGFFEASLIYAKQTVTMLIRRPKWFLVGVGTTCGISLIVLSINPDLLTEIYILTAILVVFFLIYDIVKYNEWKRTLSEVQELESSKSVEQERKSIPVLFWKPVSETGTTITSELHAFILTAWMFVCLMIGALVIVPVNLTFDFLILDAETHNNYSLFIFLLGIVTLTVVWFDTIVKSLAITIRSLLKGAYQSFIDIIVFIKLRKWRIIQVIISSAILLIMVIALTLDDLIIAILLPIESLSIVFLLVIWFREVTGLVKETTRNLFNKIESLILSVKTFTKKMRNSLTILSLRISFNVRVLSYYLLNNFIVVLILIFVFIISIFGFTLLCMAVLPDEFRIALIDSVLNSTQLAFIYDIFSPAGKTDPDAYKLVNLFIGMVMLIVPAWIAFITLLKRQQFKRTFITKPRRPPIIGGFDAIGLRNALQSNANIQRYIKEKHPPEIIREMITILGEFNKYKLITGFLLSPEERIYRHSQVILDRGYPDSDKELWKFLNKQNEKGYLAAEVLYNSDNPEVIKKLKTKIKRKKKLVIPDYLRELIEYDDRRDKK
jgi:hypothetical protein